MLAGDFQLLMLPELELEPAYSDEPLLIVAGGDDDVDETVLVDEPLEEDFSPLLAEPIPCATAVDAATNNRPNANVVERMESPP